MLKKFMKFIGRMLGNIIGWVKREAEAYQLLQKQRRYHEHWAKLMYSGCKVRDLQTAKLDVCDTLLIVTDDGLAEEYMGGRVVGREYIDSTNW